MNRWIVFDQATANAASQGTHPVDRRGGHEEAAALSEAVRQSSATVLVMPASNGRALVAKITRPQPAPVRSIDDTRLHGPNVTYAPTGFLGLDDTVVMEEPPARPKKWWEKILDG